MDACFLFALSFFQVILSYCFLWLLRLLPPPGRDGIFIHGLNLRLLFKRVESPRRGKPLKRISKGFWVTLIHYNGFTRLKSFGFRREEEEAEAQQSKKSACSRNPTERESERTEAEAFIDELNEEKRKLHERLTREAQKKIERLKELGKD